MKGLLISVCTLLLCVSCTLSAPLVFDDSIAEDRSATVSFIDIKPTHFNGIAVEGWSHVRIPAGAAKIEGTVSNRSYYAKGKVFNYNFKAGQSYIVMFKLDAAGYWGVGIYDNPNHNTYPAKDTLIAFVPFKKM